MSSPIPSVLKETELLLLQKEQESGNDPKKNLRPTGKMSQVKFAGGEEQHSEQGTSIMTEIPLTTEEAFDIPPHSDKTSFSNDNLLAASPPKEPNSFMKPAPIITTQTLQDKPQVQHSRVNHSTQTYSRPPMEDEMLHEYFAQRREEEFEYDPDESIFVSMSRFFFCFSIAFFLILISYGSIVWYADYNTPTFLFYFMLLLVIGFLSTLAIVKMFQVRTRRHLYPEDSSTYDVLDAILFISLFFFLVGSFAAYGLDNSFFLYFSLILVVLIVIFFIIQIASAAYGTTTRQAQSERENFNYQRI